MPNFSGTSLATILDNATKRSFSQPGSDSFVALLYQNPARTPVTLIAQASSTFQLPVGSPIKVVQGKRITLAGATLPALTSQPVYYMYDFTGDPATTRQFRIVTTPGGSNGVTVPIGTSVSFYDEAISESDSARVLVSYETSWAGYTSRKSFGTTRLAVAEPAKASLSTPTLEYTNPDAVGTKTYSHVMTLYNYAFADFGNYDCEFHGLSKPATPVVIDAESTIAVRVTLEAANA